MPLGAGGYLVLGTTQYRDGRSRGWAARLGPSGERLSERELALGGDHVLLVRAASAGSGSTYAVGASAPTTSGRDGAQRALVVRLEPDGRPAWARLLPDLAEAFATAVAAAEDGTVVVAGHARETASERVVFAVALSPSGEVLWRARFGPWVDPDVDAARALRGGDWIVTGSFGIVRLGPDGGLRWARETGGAGAVAELPDGSLALAAIPTGGDRRSLFVLRLSAAGDPLWQTRIPDPEICSVAGLWISEPARIVAGGNPCDGRGLWIGELTAEGARRAGERIEIRPGARTLELGPAPGGGLVAAGLFGVDAPEAGRGWVARILR